MLSRRNFLNSTLGVGLALATQQCGRFRSEADIERFSVCTEPVAFDPKRTSAAA